VLQDDDEADTVGCCSLKVEHVTLIAPSSLQVPSSFWHLLNLLKLSFILALFIVPSPAFSCHIYICAFLQLTPVLSYLGF
jgi:hypothetical protein